MFCHAMWRTAGPTLRLDCADAPLQKQKLGYESIGRQHSLDWSKAPEIDIESQLGDGAKKPHRTRDIESRHTDGAKKRHSVTCTIQPVL